jgi:putative transposase
LPRPLGRGRKLVEMFNQGFSPLNCQTMPYTTIFIHSVWATKDRQPTLKKDIREQIFDHILKNAKTKNITINTIGGYNEHIHALLSLDATQSVSNLMNLIKGECSFWINKSHLMKGKFEWQDEYYATSVAPSTVDLVRDYILHQEFHHQKKTFTQEYKEFIRTCLIDYQKG